MDVLKGILSEDTAYVIPMDLFKGIATVSSEIIIRRIDKYLNNTDANIAVQRRVEEAYSEVMEKKNYYEDENLQKVAQEIGALTYQDIHAGQPVEKLERWQQGIQSILDSPYAVAYIPPIKVDTLNELLQVIVKRAEESKSRELYDVAESIRNNKALFKDAPFKGYRGTPVKRIIKNKTHYAIMLKGLDFLIGKKKDNANPQTWRYM